MKKQTKFLSLVVVLFMALSLLPSFTFTASAAPNNVVYVNGTTGLDSNNGLSTETAYKTFAKAYDEVSDGGTIMVNGNTIADNSYIAPAKAVTITSDNNSELSFRMLFLNGETTFKNMTLKGQTSGFGIYANGFPLTLGEGLTIAPNNAQDTIFIVGGEVFNNDASGMVAPSGRGSNITVLSGDYRSYAFVAGPVASIGSRGGNFQTDTLYNTIVTATGDLNVHIGGNTAFIRDFYAGGLGYDSLVEGMTYGNSYITIDAPNVEIGNMLSGNNAQSLWIGHTKAAEMKQAEDAKTVIHLIDGHIAHLLGGSENLQFNSTEGYNFYTNMVELIVDGGTIGLINAGGVTVGLSDFSYDFVSADTVDKFVIRASVPVTSDGTTLTEIFASGIMGDIIGYGPVTDDSSVNVNRFEVVLSEGGEMASLLPATDWEDNQATDAPIRKITFNEMGSTSTPASLPAGFNELHLSGGSTMLIDNDLTLNALTADGNGNTIVYKANSGGELPLISLADAISADTPITLRFANDHGDLLELTGGTAVIEFDDENNADISQIGIDPAHGNFVLVKSDNRFVLLESYTVTFDPNGGTRTGGGDLSQSVVHGGAAVAPTLTQSGYMFNGWDKTFSDVTSDLTVTARWTSNSGGGSSTGGTTITTSNSVSPVTAAFDKTTGSANNKDIAVMLTVGSGSLSAIKNGSATLIEGTDYTKSGNNYTIKTAYLATLPTGTATLTFDMSSGVDPTIKITVSESEIGATTPELWANPFIDIFESDWFYDDVKYVHQNGLFAGTSANTFSPQMPMTRGMVVTVLGQLAGIDTADYSGDSFDDVDTAQWYAPYVKWAAELGIVSGVGNNNYAPNTSISRQDLAVILNNYADKMGLTMKQTMQMVVFVDSDDISDYAADAVGNMVRAGIIYGKPGNVFDPKAEATRAEVAAMLHRFAEAVK